GAGSGWPADPAGGERGCRRKRSPREVAGARRGERSLSAARRATSRMRADAHSGGLEDRPSGRSRADRHSRQDRLESSAHHLRPELAEGASRMPPRSIQKWIGLAKAPQRASADAVNLTQTRRPTKVARSQSRRQPVGGPGQEPAGRRERQTTRQPTPVGATPRAKVTPTGTGSERAKDSLRPPARAKVLRRREPRLARTAGGPR